MVDPERSGRGDCHHFESETFAAGSFEKMSRRLITTVLDKTGWRIGGQGGAAEILGLKRTTLDAKMKKLRIERSNKSTPI
jgi:transcriptional regulator with GAF, ATPase, and Fis domain